MKLKQAIIQQLDRDRLKQVLDALELDGVDRRSVDEMRASLSRAHRAANSDLLGYSPDRWLLTHPDHYSPISR